MTPDEAKQLREPFPDAVIGKLPRVTCKACSDSREKHCDRHSRINCQVCGNWISEKHIHLDYVGHAATTDRLLQTDPSWTWEFVPEHPMNVAGLWIKLTICGVSRYGFGDGKNPKEMIGDAIRNAAMRFGVALDLWAKEDLHANESEPSDPESSAPAGAPARAAGGEPSFVTNTDIEAMTGPQLIDALRERGLQLGGTVPEMRARLAAA